MYICSSTLVSHPTLNITPLFVVFKPELQTNYKQTRARREQTLCFPIGFSQVV